jgi:glutathione synthase
MVHSPMPMPSAHIHDATCAGVAQPLSDRDLEIADAIGPILAERGLLLAGIDVIGDYVTEINVTSPTCFQEIFDQTGFDVAAMFIEALEDAVEEAAG